MLRSKNEISNRPHILQKGFTTWDFFDRMKEKTRGGNMYGAIFIGRRTGCVGIDDFISSIKGVCVTQEQYDKLLAHLEEKRRERDEPK